MAENIEYALAVEWSNNNRVSEIEFIPARNVGHAEQMAVEWYGHRPSWTVCREIQPWHYASASSTKIASVANLTPFSVGTSR